MPEETPDETQEPRAGELPKRGKGKPFQGGAANPNSPESAGKLRERVKELEKELAVEKGVVEALRLTILARDERIDELEGRRGVVVVTATLMRRVFSQRPEQDVGETEARLRGWLEDDVKGYLADIERRDRLEKGSDGKDERIAELEAKVAELESKMPVSEGDEGSERVEHLCRELLDRCNKAARGGK